MAEALAALAVLALAMGQVSEILFPLYRRHQTTNSSTAAARAVLADFQPYHHCRYTAGGGCAGIAFRSRSAMTRLFFGG